jgi:hypothetical protein
MKMDISCWSAAKHLEAGRQIGLYYPTAGFFVVLQELESEVLLQNDTCLLFFR